MLTTPALRQSNKKKQQSSDPEDIFSLEQNGSSCIIAFVLSINLKQCLSSKMGPPVCVNHH